MASTCLPGIFPPHRIGENLYLDGVLSDQVPLKPAIDAGADTVYVLAVNHASPQPDLRSPGQILRHALTILLFPRIRLDALDLPDRDPSLRIVQIPSAGAQVALWDMSKHFCPTGGRFMQGRRRAGPRRRGRCGPAGAT